MLAKVLCNQSQAFFVVLAKTTRGETRLVKDASMALRRRLSCVFQILYSRLIASMSFFLIVEGGAIKVPALCLVLP